MRKAKLWQNTIRHLQTGVKSFQQQKTRPGLQARAGKLKQTNRKNRLLHGESIGA